MIIHTKTQAEYDELMEKLEKDGYRWMTNDLPTDHNFWSDEKKNTCVKLCSDKTIFYNSKDYYHDCKVIPFKEWKENKEEDSEDYYDTILSECIKIAKERGEQYGTSDENFADIRTILKTIFDLDLTEEHIVQVMIATKLSRDKHKPKEDNMIDLVNYTAILAHFRK